MKIEVEIKGKNTLLAEHRVKKAVKKAIEEFNEQEERHTCEIQEIAESSSKHYLALVEKLINRGESPAYFEHKFLAHERTLFTGIEMVVTGLFIGDRGKKEILDKCYEAWYSEVMEKYHNRLAPVAAASRVLITELSAWEDFKRNTREIA